MSKKNNKALTDREAFEAILNDDKYRLSLALEEQKSLASYKHLYNAGRLNLTRIENFLEKHGYRIAQERLWLKEEE